MKARIKGWFGEKKSAFVMWYALNKNTYHRYHNLILTSANGTTQIDHLVVSVYGLFIVETKHRKGWIYGSKDQRKWTQTIFHKKYKFQNPLYQAYRQKKVLIECLQVDENEIFTIIYFNGNCEFKTELPKNVIKSGLTRYIKSFKRVILTRNDVDRIKTILDRYISESTLKNKDHINSLNERHNSKAICPTCGAALIKRTARKGKYIGREFIGCENFPTCRFARKL